MPFGREPRPSLGAETFGCGRTDGDIVACGRQHRIKVLTECEGLDWLDVGHWVLSLNVSEKRALARHGEAACKAQSHRCRRCHHEGAGERTAIAVASSVRIDDGPCVCIRL